MITADAAEMPKPETKIFKFRPLYDRGMQFRYKCLWRDNFWINQFFFLIYVTLPRSQTSLFFRGTRAPAKDEGKEKRSFSPVVPRASCSLPVARASRSPLLRGGRM